MTREALRQAVLEALAAVAPEIDLKRLDPRTSLRDQYDLDSVDFLNFIVAVHTATGFDIPEADYPKLATLDDCLTYLAPKCGAA